MTPEDVIRLTQVRVPPAMACFPVPKTVRANREFTLRVNGREYTGREVHVTETGPFEMLVDGDVVMKGVCYPA